MFKSIILGALLGTFCAANALAAPYIYNLNVNGYARIAKIYLPADTSIESPVLFYFDGYGGTAENSDIRKHFQTYWPEAIIVYAEGRAPYNGNLPNPGWRIRFPYINEVCGEQEDLTYIDEIMDHLRLNYAVDENRIYASGHSSGAFFTLALMELKPDLFKGFAMLGAYSRYRVNANNIDCSDDTDWTSATPLELGNTAYSETPRPVLYMFGAFENFDYDGPNARRSYSSSCNDDSRFRNTVDQLLIRNKGTIPDCTNSPTDYIKVDERTTFAPWSNSGAETQIWLYAGSHSWDQLPEDTSQVVVDYFKELPPQWEINNKGNVSFGPWKLARSNSIGNWNNTVFADFDGDGLADVFERKIGGYWRISYLTGDTFGPWQDVGSAGDTLFENMRFADFDGDGKTDVYRRLINGQWQINYMGSNNSGTRFGPWIDVGSAGDTQLSSMAFADFDGDGKTDVYRRLINGQWQINYMGSNNSGTRFGPWIDVGSAGDTLLSNTVFAHFDSDGKTDVIRLIEAQ